MGTTTIIILILFIGWFLDKKDRARAEKEEKLMGKLDEILDEIKGLNDYLNPDDDYTND